MDNKKILLLGRWGKTHAFAKAIVEKSSRPVQLFSYMDKPNAGILPLVEDYQLGDMQDNDQIIAYARKMKIDYTIAVPHLALSNSITEEMHRQGLRCLGPTGNCARLETNKTFLRRILRDCRLDVSPRYEILSSKEDIIDHIRSIDYEFVVKPAGVTEGDGVKVMGIQLKNKREAIDYVHEIFEKNIGGITQVLIEEKLIGREYTVQAFVDGKVLRGMPATRDYKLLYEGEEGLNTPGMGSISFPDHLLPFLSRAEYRHSLSIMEKVVERLFVQYGETYRGFLSGQFIKTAEGIKVIEFNVRPGDSEILNIIPILETDFVEICDAILDRTLSRIEIHYEPKATVCKYVVVEGFPHPRQDMVMTIDETAIRRAGADLFYSCFKIGRNTYKPSPRGVAVTAKGETLPEANRLCEELITRHIKGEKLWHRTDIGTEDLLSFHERRVK